MKPPRLLCLLAPIAALGACSNPVDPDANVLPYLSEQEVIEDSSPHVPSGACDCLTVGRWYRFDTLALTSIDGEQHPVISTLNNLWAADIAASELSIMMEITAVDAASVTTRVLNGARIDGSSEVCALEDTAVEITFPRDGCRLDTSSDSSFNVYAGTEAYPKNCTTTLPVQHAIPVSRARLEGTVSDDCGQILSGKVPSGGLGQSELGQLCTCLLLPGDPAEKCGTLEPGFTDGACVGCNANYKSLSQLLTAFGEVTWSCQTEAGAPAACITADFTAVAMDAGPGSCGQ